MPLVTIDGRQIRNWRSFHSVFASAFGFPDFYGRNMNAWIDCMTSLDDPDAGMTSVHRSAADPIVLQLDHVNAMPNEIYDELVAAAAFVNWRRLEVGETAILMLSFDRSA
ncbi:MAG TPA: barstar family protein [Phycisphaerae bacterium]|nr:barstar family protein [Phycisphaerae bacterium]HRW51817.1 barstar family protein [Phycisphaerae bacterium]